MKSKKKFNYKQFSIETCSDSSSAFKDLFIIFCQTLKPDMKWREFVLYYQSKKLQYIDVTFLYEGEHIIGFCAAAFYTFICIGKECSLGRSAIGVLPQYQKKGFPKWILYYKYIRYKLHHPFRQLILSAYVANPIVYAMICKYTGIVYPRFTTQVSKEIEKQKNDILHSSGLQKRESAPFVVKINFNVEKDDQMLHRIMQSNNVHVQFFISQTKLEHCITLLVIIPISWLNIILTVVRFVGFAFMKPFLKKGVDKLNKINNLVVQISKLALNQKYLCRLHNRPTAKNT